MCVCVCMHVTSAAFFRHTATLYCCDANRSFSDWSMQKRKLRSLQRTVRNTFLFLEGFVSPPPFSLIGRGLCIVVGNRLIMLLLKFHIKFLYAKG